LSDQACDRVSFMSRNFCFSFRRAHSIYPSRRLAPYFLVASIQCSGQTRDCRNACPEIADTRASRDRPNNPARLVQSRALTESSAPGPRPASRSCAHRPNRGCEVGSRSRGGTQDVADRISGTRGRLRDRSDAGFSDSSRSQTAASRYLLPTRVAVRPP